MSPGYKSEDKAKALTTAVLPQTKRKAASTGQSFREFSVFHPSDAVSILCSAFRLGPSASRPVIPKRGDKEYEPTSESNLQKYNLGRARVAMFDALRAERTISKYESPHRVDGIPPDRVNIARP